MKFKEIYFNNRAGQTVLSVNEKKGLKLAHIYSIHELNEAEQANIQDGLWGLEEKTPANVLDESFFRKLHKMLFAQVWKWAGEYRQSEKNIGIEAWKVPTEIAKLIDDTQYWLEHKSYPRNELLAHFHHRLVSIHPFPNGNGRFSRILTNLLCREQDWQEPNWKSSLPPDERRKVYIEALRSADLRDYEKLYNYFL